MKTKRHYISGKRYQLIDGPMDGAETCFTDKPGLGDKLDFEGGATPAGECARYRFDGERYKFVKFCRV